VSDATPTDAFNQPIHVGDTVVVSANSSTASPGLVQARVTGFTPSRALVDLVITRVGREQGTAINEVGAKLRRQTGRVQVLSFRESSDV